ncbi:hypothetical protein RDI58_006134 [Solanum bulbocastanum]|uniref:TF-B3 domain-containing protein n=1 Tax=Solanum bulbocastanum TaxID=147425 RepID=A0AAN8YNA3_SOLBU
MLGVVGIGSARKKNKSLQRKMKIKVVHRSEPPNQERVSVSYPDMPKKEVFDEEQENQQLGTQEPEPEPDSAIPKLGNDNLSLVDASIPIDSLTPSTQTPISSLLGKRRRKPKEMIDQISTIPFRKKRVFKKQSQSINYLQLQLLFNVRISSIANLSKQMREPGIGVADAGRSTKLERATADGSGSATQMKSPIIIRAEEFLLSIGNEFPSFMKLLVRSHVGSCFWMGLPVPFCKNHLPRKDTPVILESETGEDYEIKYIAEKTGLSAGWRKYAAAHKLVEGDVLVFQLVEPTRFKVYSHPKATFLVKPTDLGRIMVYVIRANDLKEVDGALSLLNLDAPAKQSDAEGTIGNNIKKRQKKSLPLTVVQKRRRKEDLSKQLVPLEAQSGNDSDEVASEILEGSRSSGLAVNFRDIKSLEEFHILVNGVCIDSELPEHIRRKYYELCCSKNAFLHDRLLQGLHCKLVAGMIFEVVNIADMVRACKLTTPRKEFDKWDKSLKSFELLGMNVGFLRTRLRWLLSLAFDSEGALDTKRYWDAKKEWSRAEDEIRNLEMKLEELKQTSGKYVADVETLKSKAESYELMFQGEVNAPCKSEGTVQRENVMRKKIALFNFRSNILELRVYQKMSVAREASPEKDCLTMDTFIGKLTINLKSCVHLPQLASNRASQCKYVLLDRIFHKTAN